MNDKIIKLEKAKGVKFPNSNDGGNGGGDMPYLTKDVFHQYEKRIDEKLDTIDTKMDKIDEKLDKNTTKVSHTFWAAIGILATVFVGFAGIIITLI